METARRREGMLGEVRSSQGPLGLASLGLLSFSASFFSAELTWSIQSARRRRWTSVRKRAAELGAQLPGQGRPHPHPCPCTPVGSSGKA